MALTKENDITGAVYWLIRLLVDLNAENFVNSFTILSY